MSVEVKILQRSIGTPGHKLGVPGRNIRIPEVLARALVARGEAEYVQDSDPEVEEAPKKSARKAKKAKKSEKTDDAE